jgi:hypothetical protein
MNPRYNVNNSDSDSVTETDTSSNEEIIYIDSSTDNSYYENSSEYSNTDMLLYSHYDDSYDYIYEEDEQHILQDKEHNKYYIGHCYKLTTTRINNNDHIENNDNIMLSLSVSLPIFFKYDINEITNYLITFGSENTRENSSWSSFNYQNIFHRRTNRNIEIMKMNIIMDGDYPMYTVIIKTHWLRLVQRHWKKIYLQRKNIIKQRGNITNLRYKELTGVYPSNIAYLPNLKGLMKNYLK